MFARERNRWVASAAFAASSEVFTASVLACVSSDAAQDEAESERKTLPISVWWSPEVPFYYHELRLANAQVRLAADERTRWDTNPMMSETGGAYSYPRRLLLGLAALAVCGPFAAILAYHYEFQLAPLWYNVIGVDVSNHQGDIDWPALARSNVAFAYIKATEGGDFRDKRFQLNWDGAKKAGLARGAYHFFTQCRAGAEQAKNFIGTVPREHGALPPVIDAEHMGPCRTGQQVSNVIREITTLLDALEAHYGRRPIIYTGSEFDAAYLQGQLAGERFWLRSLFWPPSFRTGQWVIWQFHNAGTRAGISGPVDLNGFRGSWKQFEAFVADEPDR